MPLQKDVVNKHHNKSNKNQIVGIIINMTKKIRQTNAVEKVGPCDIHRYHRL